VTGHSAPTPPWRKRARQPLVNVLEVGRLKLAVAVTALCLLVGGFSALTGLNGDSSRLLGFAALVGGVILTIVIVLYLLRPTEPD
jgi:hypothetical protein